MCKSILLHVFLREVTIRSYPSQSQLRNRTNTFSVGTIAQAMPTVLSRSKEYSLHHEHRKTEETDPESSIHEETGGIGRRESIVV